MSLQEGGGDGLRGSPPAVLTGETARSPLRGRSSPGSSLRSRESPAQRRGTPLVNKKGHLRVTTLLVPELRFIIAKKHRTWPVSVEVCDVSLFLRFILLSLSSSSSSGFKISVFASFGGCFLSSFILAVFVVLPSANVTHQANVPLQSPPSSQGVSRKKKKIRTLPHSRF